MLKSYELIDNGKFDEAITSQVRKVKWLYNNSNKLTNVIDEKFVRLIVHKMKEKMTGNEDATIKMLEDIISWEKDLSEYKSLEKILRDKYVITERIRVI
jgi:hypothetical protein